MKTISAFFISALCIFSSCNSNSENKLFNFVTKEGKGPIEQKEYQFDFDEIKVSQSIDAEVVKSDHEKVVVNAPSDIINDVLAEKVGDKLYVHFKPGINISAKNVSVKIFAKDFSEIEANSSADIKVLDKFTQDETSIKVSSSGSISGDFEANDLEIDGSSSGSYSGKIWAVNLDVDVSSSADINISGKTKKADMDASSSGSINANGVFAQVADLKASSSGSINLSVSETLSATASSGGSVEVKKIGNLQIVTQNANSGGSVNVR